MNVQDVPRGDIPHDDGHGGDYASVALISAASALLAQRRRDIADDFVAKLFGLAVPQDLERYTAEELADMAERSWSVLQDRRAGTAKIKFEPLPGKSGGAVLEIVNDDMPFLVDSVVGEINQRGLGIRLFVHPVFVVERDPSGRLVNFKGARNVGGQRESLIHIHLDGVDDAEQRADLVREIDGILADVRVSVQDWKPMLSRISSIIADLRSNPPPLPVDEIAEAIQFLEWIEDDNFTLLGARDYSFNESGDTLEPSFETGLGLLRSHGVRLLQRWNQPLTITPEIRAFLEQPKLLIVTKATIRSRVHRRVYLDYIGIKRFDRDGKLVGERRFCGLFTSTAYTRPPRSIPFLRRKIDSVIRRAGFDPASHSGKALANVLETYPRDELFQIDEDMLYQFALAILQLDERPRARVLPRRDRFDRFVSVLVYVPRDRYDSKVRAAIGNYLAKAFNGRVSAYLPFFPETPLVRVHFIIGRNQGEAPNPDRAVLDRDVQAIVRSWTDDLCETLSGASDSARGSLLFARYRDAFPIDYREIYPPPAARADIGVIEALAPERPLGVTLYRNEECGPQSAGLKVFSHNRPIPLSERVPVLENMGFRVVDERTYHIQPKDSEPVWFHDMTLESALGQDFDLAALKDRLEACFLVVMGKKAESDGYNALVLASGLGWRDVALIRTFSRFLRQIRVAYSQDYMWATLRKYPAIAAQIVALFRVRFEPHSGRSQVERAAREAEIAAAIESALQAVESLDEDRILRHFVNAVRAAIRTNFYQIGSDGFAKELIAVKFSSRKVDGMPLPRPLYEVFLYSPRLEAVHLRFGKVARGGIRWSDRPQDFRTEILGLVKAQNVKNAVIVPVGAKGGFVPKYLPASGPREAIQAEGVATYKLFISTLLDITDNIGPGTRGVIPPRDVVRHDDDDPYLVVAADKGTATFSDIANELAIAHDFWLGDAFASGGSAGYDHKKMGITARGAWESVKRHFREMDVDIGVTPFTVVGIGDMSGDVFRNGLLREKTTKLIAAFDHRDIFIDPEPDPERSFAERQRLFDLPRSSWQYFDKSIISKGGGVYPRRAKEISPSLEAQKLFGVAAHVTPQDLIRAILRAQVDLIFFGGIGTYIRASDETDDAVGDRANDPIRVTGKDLRCKVIGEGANLGMTQRGRIEAAVHGIRLNTDAIDNSAGVNTSDMEVNIKIALSIPLRDGRLTLPARNLLLAGMTDEVADLVLRNNYLQPLAISLSQRRGMEDFGFLQRLIQTLETRGHLDRTVEYLPDDLQLTERRRRAQPFTRPELAVLLAYAKLTLYDDLLESAVPDDPYLGRELGRYFPKAVAERYPDALEHHRLRREIIATQLANSMINRGGPSLIVRIADQTGAAPSAVAQAFAAVRDSYGMTALNAAIDSLDNKISGKLQLDLYAAVQDLLLDRIVWFLRHADLSKGLAEVVTHYRDGIAAVAAALDGAISQDLADARAARRQTLAEGGVPADLACRIADLRVLTSAPDIVLVSDRTGKPVGEVAAIYFAAGAFFRLDRIAAASENIPITDYFDRLALDRARDSIGDAERRLTAAMVGNGAAGAGAVEAWIAPRKAEVERIRLAVQEIAGSGLTLSKLSVAASLLGDLVKS
ncbi:MAG TPA: NAD-glutamate dehydrogenase [Xanthobacteraceae bacterium]|nr:NAD-glutamate dehydrogenase [Xanthobacteraceae bacterium]